MAISLVPSGAISNSAGNGADVTLTFPTLQENDVVIVFGGHSNRAANTPGPETGGYVSLVNHTAASPFFDVSWKRMGPTPDTEVICHGTGNTADAAAYGAFCLRGVILTGTPTDQTTTTNGPTTSTNPDPPSITTQTHGAWVLAMASNAVNDASITAPSGYSNGISNTNNETGEDHSTAGATLLKETAGAENPPTFTTWANGAWYAVSVAIKPEPIKQLATLGVG